MEGDTNDLIKSTGDIVDSTIQSTGDIMDNTIQSPGDIMDSAVQSTGDIMDCTIQPTGDIMDSTIQPTGDIMDCTIQPPGDIMDSAVQSTGDIMDSTIQPTSDIVDSAIQSTGDIMDSTIKPTGDIDDSDIQSTGDIIDPAIHSEGDVMQSSEDIMETVIQSTEDNMNSTSHSGDVVSARTSVIVLNDHRARIKRESNNKNEEQEESIIVQSPQISNNDVTHRLNVGAVYTYLPTPTHSASSVIIQPGQISIPIQIISGRPQWAAQLKDCQKVGTSFRGYVENEIELDILLTYHKQETGSFWGTRQSPSAERSSKRLMWRSQYVPYDGIPFVNMGSRAVTMECQFGPRRKSKSWKAGSSKHFKTSCPARIYIKKVLKFPQYKAANINDKKDHDRVFQSIKDIGVDQVQGVERYYVQLPTIQAHDYHEPITTESVLQPMLELQRQETPPEERMNPKVARKIQDLMSEGISNDFQIRAKLRQYVLQDLFKAEKTPDRHDPRFFPTINNIQNYKHEINKAVERGELILAHKVGIIEKCKDNKLIAAWIDPPVKDEHNDGHSSDSLSDMAGDKFLSQINTTKTTKSGIVTCTEVSDIETTNSSQSASLLPMLDPENNQSNSLLQDSGTESLLSEMQNNQSVIESADHMTGLEQSDEKDPHR